MWDSYAEMVRVASEGSDRLSVPQIVIAGTMYHAAFDMMAKAGGALQVLLPEENVDSIPVADDVASLRVSTFRATMRIDVTFRQEIEGQRHELNGHLKTVPVSEREAATVELMQGLLPVAVSLQAAFSSAVKRLYPAPAV